MGDTATHPEMLSQDQAGADSPTCQLWNPHAAAIWSVLFTPIFGAFILMANWYALGRPDKAAGARRWCYAGLCVLLLQIISGAINARLDSEAWLIHPVTLLFLLLWYAGPAREQATLVKARHGSQYRRRSWDTPLLGAVMAAGIYAAASALFTLAFVHIT